MLTRIITGVIAFILFVGVLLLGEIPFAIGMGIVSFIMLHEGYGAVAKSNAVKVSGYVAGIILMIGVLSGYVELALVCSITIVMIFLVILHTKAEYKELFSTYLMTVYIILFMSFIPRLYMEMGVGVMAIIFIIAWGSDTSAYFCGTFLGKHKLIPRVSPKKTIEGAVGGIVITALLCVLYAFIMHKCNAPLMGITPNASIYLRFAIIGLVASALSQVGDLTASAIKRDANIKDYGKILPGHGGLLDRFDSVMFIAPAVYYLFTYII